MQTYSTFQLKPSDKAPDFSLPDYTNKLTHLADHAGKKGTLICFVCNHCPYVIHLADALASVAKAAHELGISTVAINSNDLEKYPQDGPVPMQAFATAHGWDFPYLLDETQHTAHAYGAACTPDFFLFDGELGLYYTGQFDATRPKSNQSATGTDLLNAIKNLAAGITSPAQATPSTGCNIKWKPGNEPSYFPH